MKIYHIVAMDEDNGIGKDGEIPWNQPEDMKRFKEITRGHAVLMGRKTYESLPGPLSHRMNVILTSQDELGDYQQGEVQDGPESARVRLSDNVGEALSFMKDSGFNEVYVIGGESVYRETLDQTDEIRMTIVHTSTEADTHYPEIDEDMWQAAFIEPREETTYIDYVRPVMKVQEGLEDGE